MARPSSPVTAVLARVSGVRIRRSEFRELGPAEIENLLEVASKAEYFAVIRTAVYSGLRLGELLGLKWEAVDFERGRIHVRHQWAREGTLTEPKTPAAIRWVVIPPDLVKFLRGHKAGSSYST